MKKVIYKLSAPSAKKTTKDKIDPLTGSPPRVCPSRVRATLSYIIVSGLHVVVGVVLFISLMAYIKLP